MDTIEFTCPRCDGHRVEEVMINVTVVTPINTIHTGDGLGDCEYGSNIINEDGEVDCFKCRKCGYVVENVKTLEGLVEFLENQQETKRRDEKNGVYPEHIDPAN